MLAGQLNETSETSGTVTRDAALLSLERSNPYRKMKTISIGD
ncbi:MAG: hypothetical protein WB579_13850 [Bryobacteraceae bacterium]